MREHLLAGIAMFLFAVTGHATEGAPPVPGTASLPGNLVLPRIKGSYNISWPGLLDREALVYLKFGVTADGRAFDIELADGGFHEERFVKASIRAVERAVFEPATLNGVPIDFPAVRLPLKFSVNPRGEEQIKGITSEFRRELTKVQKFIRDGDPAGAHFHAQWMLAEKVKLNYEYAVLEAQVAQTHAAVGNTHRAIEALRRVTARTNPDPQAFSIDQSVARNSVRNYLLPKEYIEDLMTLRIRLTTSQGYYLEALKTSRDLIGLMELTPDDPRFVLAKKLEDALRSDARMVAKIRLGEAGTWQHDLYRRSFTLTKVQGKVSSMCLVCDSKCRPLRYEEGVDWTLAANWNNCKVEFIGEPGSNFELLEYGNSELAAAAAAATAQ